MGARAGYHAARLSIESLLAGSPFCYLWTLTTEKSTELGPLLKMWSNLTKHWDGFKALRVAEKHTKGHGYHVHFITPNRYDVRQVRPRTTQYGFGRINVKRIPSEKAYYVIKYLIKGVGQQTGRRMWACVGFKGVRSSDVLITDSYWQQVYKQICPSGYNLAARRMVGLNRLLARQFRREPNEKPNTMDKKHNDSVLARLEKGEAVCVAEYRTPLVDSLKITIKNDPQGRKEERFVIRHGLELNGKQAQLIEWLPPGAIKPDPSTFIIKKGEMCLVVLKKYLQTMGGPLELSGEVIPLR